MYNFTAKVISGRKTGRELGFPTANLDKLDLPISHGVYAVEVKPAGKSYQGLMHYGPKKTFDGEVTREVYIKNFSQNIYGQTLEVKVIRKIREVRRFKNIEELKKQISKDLLELNKS
ncbi:MAG: riboflavin kinase [bacterium]|nr:riboflavin kinase [bacterium]